MITFDGATVIQVLDCDTPTQVFLQNRSSANVYVHSDKILLMQSINPLTKIPNDGFLIPFGEDTVEWQDFVGELWGYSPINGSSLIIMTNPRNVNSATKGTKSCAC